MLFYSHLRTLKVTRGSKQCACVAHPAYSVAEAALGTPAALATTFTHLMLVNPTAATKQVDV